MASQGEGSGVEGVSSRPGDTGSHQIDFAMLDDATRQQVIDCIKKNGKISVMIDDGDVDTRGVPGGGFSRLID